MSAADTLKQDRAASTTRCSGSRFGKPELEAIGDLTRERLYVARGRYSAGAIGRARCGAAIAKTIAELTSQQEGFIRQQVIEQLMRQIMHYDVEFRREEATSAVGSNAKH